MKIRPVVFLALAAVVACGQNVTWTYTGFDSTNSQAYLDDKTCNPPGKMNPRANGSNTGFIVDVNFSCKSGTTTGTIQGTLEVNYSPSTITGPWRGDYIQLETPLAIEAVAQFQVSAAAPSGTTPSTMGAIVYMTGANGFEQADTVPSTCPASQGNGSAVSASCTIQLIDGFSPTTIPSLSAGAVLKVQAGFFAGYVRVYGILKQCTTADCSGPGQGSISLTRSQPATGDALLAGSDKLPMFFGAGTYSYGKPARVNLLLLDDGGTILGTASAQSLPAATDGSTWGGKSPFLVVASVPSPPFPTGKPGDKVGTLHLQAILLDADTFDTVAKSNVVDYPVLQPPHITLSFGWVTVGSFASDTINPLALPPALGGSASLFVSMETETKISGIISNQSVRAVLTGDGSIGVDSDLDVLVDAVTGDFPKSIGTTDSKSVPRNQDLSAQPVLLSLTTITLPGKGDQIRFTPRLTTTVGQKVLFPPVSIPLEYVFVESVTPSPACSKGGNCIVAGQATTLRVALSVNSSPVPGRAVQRNVAGLGVTVLDGPEPDLDVFVVNAPASNPSNAVYGLVDRAQNVQPDYETYYSFVNLPEFSVMAAVKVTASTGGGSAGVAQGKLTNVSSATDRDEINYLDGWGYLTPIGPIFSAVPAVRDAYGNGRSAAANPDAASVPDLLGIATTWTFDPPIPHDGTFSANLTLNYSAADFPADPNFDESKLQIVSVDSNGVTHLYQTTLDMAKKTATAFIDGLDPSYSLAVAGPFAQAAVMMANAGSGYVLTNSGSKDASLATSEYDASGAPADPSQTASTLKTGRQLSGNPAAWVCSWPSASSNVAGVSWVDTGAHWALLPQGSASTNLIFTDVEYDAQTSTTIGLTNTSAKAGSVTAYLRAPDGSTVSTYTILLQAQQTLVQPVQAMFPEIMAGFSGYVAVAGKQPLLGYLRTSRNSVTAAMNAQVVNPASLGLTRFYAAGLGGAGTGATLHLVNVMPTDANVTVHAYTSAGVKAGADVSFKLGSKLQRTLDLGTAFAVDPATIALVSAESDTGGLFGDVNVFDVDFVTTYQIGLPLTGQTLTNSVLPLATNQSTVFVSNPGSAQASVTVTPYGPDGTAGAASTVTLPANGSSTVVLTKAPLTGTGGYVTIGSTQPLVVSAKVQSAGGGVSGYVGVAGSTPVGPPPVLVPVILISPLGLDFGVVLIGQSKDLTLTIQNAGTAALTVASATSSDAQFTFPDWSGPLTLAPSATRNVTVRFKPTATGSQQTTLTFPNNDPDRSDVWITARGTGDTGTLSNPAISIAPLGLDFGVVLLGQSKDLTLALQNTGSAALTVASVTSADAQFTFTDWNGPLTLAPSAARNVTVRFKPTTAGNQQATLTFASNDPNRSNVSITARGTGDAGTVSNLVPIITTLTPPQVASGTSGFLLTITGSNFVTGSTMQWNGTARPTKVLGATQVQATISSTDVGEAGSAAVTVVNPAPGGGESGGLNFSIVAPGAAVSINQLDVSSCTIVNAFVSATDRSGNAIPGLGQQNLKCSEDGAAVACSVSPASDTTDLSLAIVLDTAAPDSMVTAEKAAVQTLLGFLNPNDRVAIVVSGAPAQILQGMTNSTAALGLVMASIVSTGGQSALYDAMTLGLQTFATQKGRRLAMLVLANSDNGAGTTTDSGTILAAIRSAGVPVFSTPLSGAGSGVRQFLYQAGLDSFGGVSTVGLGLDLSMQQLGQVVANQSLVTYVPSAGAKPHTMGLNMISGVGSASTARTYLKCGQ